MTEKSKSCISYHNYKTGEGITMTEKSKSCISYHNYKTGEYEFFDEHTEKPVEMKNPVGLQSPEGLPMEDFRIKSIAYRDEIIEIKEDGSIGKTTKIDSKNVIW